MTNISAIGVNTFMTHTW